MLDWLVFPIVAAAAWFTWRQLAPRGRYGKGGGKGAACGGGCSGCDAAKPSAARAFR
ncbi:hypothetical protein [Caldimonas sp. KR1-144]|uniref:hypothetical protein n=1 Tax=Caldimonas sp. KR1-144 TaxID=3400911 RepID=UPI003C080FA4